MNLTVTDDDSGEGTGSTTLTVTNVAPVLGEMAATSVDENGTTHLTGTITDPGALDTFTLVVNWGDGDRRHSTCGGCDWLRRHAPVPGR